MAFEAALADDLDDHRQEVAYLASAAIEAAEMGKDVGRRSSPCQMGTSGSGWMARPEERVRRVGRDLQRFPYPDRNFGAVIITLRATAQEAVRCSLRSTAARGFARNEGTAATFIHCV
jgi:hypothetical protein